jgi:UDP-N-acetylmuramate--alanine ligase
MPLAGRSVYFVGIGGSGMSGLARLLQARGARVSGSDAAPSPLTEALARDGMAVGFDQASAWLPEDCDLVVASAAIKPDHPQLLEADRRGITHLSYAEALGWSMVGRTGICVAGTHGKSSTTAMLGVALASAGLDPSVIVGATCAQLSPAGGGFRLGSETIAAGSARGKPGLLVVEACEFNRSFHNYRPRIAAITNVEADHLDVYGSLEAVIEAFHDFAKLLPPASAGGVLLIADKDAHRREITAGLECDVQTIGFSPSCDWSISYDPSTRKTGLVKRGTGLVAAWTTALPGEHMAFNAAVAATLSILAGADPDLVGPALSGFRGLDRRMQFLGERRVGHSGGTVRVYDDYGHHPTEVDTTLRALRQFEKPEARGGRLICVFQPHQHSRTRFLLEEFAQAFSAADVVIVPHIYFVRDSVIEKTKVSAADLVDRLRAKGVQAMHLYPFEAIIEQLENVCRPGDLLVVMGAGPVDGVAKGFLELGRAAGGKGARAEGTGAEGTRAS